MTKPVINRTKKYEEFVFSSIYEEIVKSTGCTQEEARALFVNAIAYNTVIEEICDKAKMLTADSVSEVAA